MCLPVTANWAQLSGPKEQNNAKQSSSVFRHRWGHAMVSYYDQRRNEKALIVFGGDTYDPATGIGALNNDVWKTRGLGV